MDETAISLGFIEIKWYSLFILFGILSATFTIWLEAKKKKLDNSLFIDAVFYGIIIGILGARLYYVLFNLDYYLKNPAEILAIWHGGLAIHGGIIATFLFLIFYTKKKKINLLLLLDMIAVGLPLAQAIGRWGNFFNQEAFGGVVSKSFLQSLHIPNFIIKGMYINGFYYHPTFLYESISSIICFIVLILLRKKKNLKVGTLTSIYLIWYGIVRLLIESLRTDALLVGDIRIAQVVSLLSILIGLVVYRKTRDNKNYIDEKIQTK